MIVNGKKFEIEDLMKSIDLNANSMNKIGSFYLTNKEMEILDRNFIEYRCCNSLKDLMIRIRDVLEDESLDPDDGDDLDFVLDSIAERDYYQNTNK